MLRPCWVAGLTAGGPEANRGAHSGKYASERATSRKVHQIRHERMDCTVMLAARAGSWSRCDVQTLFQSLC